MDQSPDERRAAGRALRSAVPRSAHGEWSPPPGRPDAFDVLEAQAASRVPELRPIRYERMAESPFAFFRGAAAVMAMDLASTPATGIRVQACGDAHVDNFGLFASPERNLVFDINDFDETVPGPWEWDVRRLCASLHVAARQRGFSPAECDVVVAAAAAYLPRATRRVRVVARARSLVRANRDQRGHRALSEAVPLARGARREAGTPEGSSPRGHQAHDSCRRTTPLHRRPSVDRAPREHGARHGRGDGPGYLGNASTFDNAVAEFARKYAITNEADHAALIDTLAS
jgi:hypothetical protein